MATGSNPTQATIQLLNMLPEGKLDRFLALLSPQTKRAIPSLKDGAVQLPETVRTEIAQAVWTCLEQ
jgi:hypothetical protein